MSVVGFDVGNDASCVAIARKRGIDVLMNKESKRETPAMVSFGDKMRFLGTDAAAKISMNPRNTPHQLKRLLGKAFSDPAVQADLVRLPFKVTEAPGGGCLVHVTFRGQPAAFTPEQLMAMVLVDLRKIAEAELGLPVNDCAITVPAFYTEVERRAMLDAAAIAGLNCLRLVNETTAAALAYGIFKTDLPDSDPVHVAFVDVGHAATQVSVVSLRKGGLAVRCHAWDRDLGGRDIDEALFGHFCAEFRQRFGIDVAASAKASFKLRSQCQRLKKVLSANAESPINIECLLDDVDVRSELSRDALEAMIAPLLARLEAVLAQALEASGLQACDIASVEVLGGCSRVPAVFKLVGDLFGCVPSRTLNAKEVVSRGAALQCAMISPLIKVRDFDVADAAPYGVALAYEGQDGQRRADTLFARHSAFPSKKAITLLKARPFSATLAYEPDARLPPAAPASLGDYSVELAQGCEVRKVKLVAELDLHGLARIVSATGYEEQQPEPRAPTPPAAGEGLGEGEGSGEGGAAGGGAAPMEGDAGSQPAAAAGEAAQGGRRVKKLPLAISAAGVAGASAAQLQGFIEAEGDMAASDKLQEDTNEAKNSLEAYTYELRAKLYARLEPFVSEAEREALCAQLSATEDWLYGEGEDETKSVYLAKLTELKARGDPIEQRAADDEGRPAAIERLQAICNGYLTLADSSLPAHSHLSASERDTLRKEAGDALSWLADKVALQAQLRKWDAPLLCVSDISKKAEVVERVCRPIASRPPPVECEPAAAPVAVPAEQVADPGEAMEADGAAEEPASMEG